MEFLAVLAAVYLVGVLIPRRDTTLRERAVDEPFASLMWGMWTFPLWGAAVVVVWLAVM